MKITPSDIGFRRIDGIQPVGGSACDRCVNFEIMNGKKFCNKYLIELLAYGVCDNFIKKEEELFKVFKTIEEFNKYKRDYRNI